jgi:hypothetical protein
MIKFEFMPESVRNFVEKKMDGWEKNYLENPRADVHEDGPSLREALTRFANQFLERGMQPQDVSIATGLPLSYVEELAAKISKDPG